MIARGALWAGAAVASVALHVGLAAALGLMISPDQVPPQQMPETRLDLAAYEVQTDRVDPAAPETEAATEGGAMPMAVGQGAVRLERVEALTPESATIMPDTAEPMPLAGAALTGTAAATAPPPAAQALTATAAPTERLSGTPPDPEPRAAASPPPFDRLAAADVPSSVAVLPAVAAASRIAAAVTPTASVAARPAVAIADQTRPSTLQPAVAAVTLPPVQTLGAASAPTEVVPAAAVPLTTDSPALAPAAEAIAGAAPPADALPLAVPDASDLSPTAPAAEALDTAATQSLATPAPPAMPQVARATAALAWTGDADESVDEVALAAIQSFMQPSDIAALRPGRVRDALTTLLASVPCSRIQAAFIPETGELELRGHIPEGDLRAPVLEAVRAQMGGAIGVTDNLLILPRPQCGALAGISAVDLPQSTDQLTNPLLVGPDAHAVNHSFVEGQRMTFDVTAPDYDAYIHIDYFDADGTVIHLKPNEFAPTKLYEAKSTLAFGMLEDDGSGIEIFIGPPFGQEIAVAFATSVPLHDGDRPIREPAGPYLEWLQERVTEARAEHPDFKGEWVYFFITTRPSPG
jgi:hypothetical protein